MFIGILEAVISTVALVASILLIYGMLPVIRQEPRSASRNLMFGVMVLLFADVARLLWFGFAQVGLARIDPTIWAAITYFAGEATPDVIHGAVFLAALYFFFRFTWFLIPESERVRYNLATAPFWPRHVRSILPRREGQNRRQNDA